MYSIANIWTKLKILQPLHAIIANIANTCCMRTFVSFSLVSFNYLNFKCKLYNILCNTHLYTIKLLPYKGIIPHPRRGSLVCNVFLLNKSIIA